LISRPEPTPLEHLPDASFLGKLLALPANVRLDWRVIARYKQSSLFGLIISNEEKSFKTLTPGDNNPSMYKSMDDLSAQKATGLELVRLLRVCRIPSFSFTTLSLENLIFFFHYLEFGEYYLFGELEHV
jgi:hypothetical protein